MRRGVLALLVTFVILTAGCTSILGKSTNSQSTTNTQQTNNFTNTNTQVKANVTANESNELIEQQKKAEAERLLREQYFNETTRLENETGQTLDSLGTLIQEAGDAIK